MKRAALGLLAALSWAAMLAACVDASPTAPVATPGPEVAPAFDWECYEGSQTGGGTITRSGSVLTLSAFGQNVCHSGAVLVQADMYWGAVSSCSDPVPQVVWGYNPGGRQAYANPAPYYVSVSDTAHVPAGATRMKAVMVGLHRFYESGAYSSPYHQFTTTTYFCEDVGAPPPPPPPTLYAQIQGPQSVQSSAGCTWYASASGGTPGYTYEWRRNGQLVSQSSDYSSWSGGGFGLELTVRDQAGANQQTKTAYISVTEDPYAGSCYY